MADISSDLNISYPKLIKEFDKIDIEEGLQDKIISSLPINLLIDATFFGREYGYLCFHDTKGIIYFREIKNENVKELRIGITHIKKAGYVINSVTIDGRRGYYNNIRKILGNVPIQMCIYHQKAIIRRYITDRPRTGCGQELKELMKSLCKTEQHQSFIDSFYHLKDKHQFLLSKRNEDGNYIHGHLRAAFKSLEDNLPYIFVYTDSKTLNIPPTINHLEGLFSHLKERVNIHRGLTQIRKKKAIKFLLKNLGK